MKKFRIAYCGTPDFSVPVLEMLSKHPHIDLVKVISMPDRPAGRGMELKSPEVVSFAKENRIPYFQTENINREEALLTELKAENLDFILVLAFAQFLSEKVLTLPRLGCFNIHTSLLPKYRGAAPIQYAILHGDTETGVSIQRMVKKMDAGDLVYSKKTPIGEKETGGELYNRLKVLAAESAHDFICQLADGKVTYEKQDESKVSFAPTLKKDEGFLDFKNKKVHDLLNQIRALHPWPGTFCFLSGKRLKIIKAEKLKSSARPGELKNDMGRLVVGCLDGCLHLQELQLEGKKLCSDRELLNGLKLDLELTTPKVEAGL